METRKKPFNQFIEKSDVIIEGTANGTAVRLLTWPLENAFYIASQKNKSSYLQIYKNTFKPKTLLELNKSFFRTGLLQTVAKSSTSIGVINYIDHYHSDYTVNQKSLYATALSTPLETLLTSRGEHAKVKDFFKIQPHRGLRNNRSALLSPEFGRVMSATFVRVLWSSLITFGGIYKTAELVQPFFANSNSMLVKPTAAFISSFVLQPLIMPIINYQTYVLKDPSAPIAKKTKQFFSEHRLRELPKGAIGRGIHRSAYYGLTFLITEIIKKYRNQSNSVEEHSLSKKKR